MATQLFGVNPGEEEFRVVSTVGPTGTSRLVAVVVDLASTGVTDGAGVTRAIEKAEVLEALRKIENQILKSNWPPA